MMKTTNFKNYNDKHINSSALLFGSGPTLKELDNSILQNIKKTQNVLFAGTNEMVYSDLPLDYYFIGDAGSKSRGFLSDPESYITYLPKIEKFIKIKLAGGHNAIPTDIDNATYYNVNKMTYMYKDENILNKNIHDGGMNDAGSISFDVLQFLLYTGVKRIYLVGHDCTYSHGSFYKNDVGSSTKSWGNTILENWNYVKMFCDKFYPDVKITSINPVELKIFENITLNDFYNKEKY